MQSLPRISLGRGLLVLGAIVLAIAMTVLLFGGAILNRYGKEKAERAFAESHPGYALRIGELDYSVVANRLVAQSVTLSGTEVMLRVGRISLTGVGWSWFLRRTAPLEDVLARARLDATNLDLEYPKARYGIRCARLRASMPASELITEGIELRPSIGDEAFFAAHTFRATRFHVVIPECRILGLDYDEALQGSSFHVRSMQIFRPSFDALVDRDKPPPPFEKSPLMVHEALAAIQQPFRVDSLSITNGHLKYCERMAVGAEPAVLTFAAVSFSVEGIANRGEATASIQLQGQGDLMNAGTLKVLMTIPISPPNFSLHYTGSLGAMDLTRLDAFLDIAEHTRIKSGSAQSVAFEIDVVNSQAHGQVYANYKNLEIALLDKQTGNEKGMADRVASVFANVLKIRNANPSETLGSVKIGEVNYTRKPDDEFQQFLWFALRTGVLDIISH
jgi:hypothetical protein